MCTLEALKLQGQEQIGSQGRGWWNGFSVYAKLLCAEPLQEILRGAVLSPQMFTATDELVNRNSMKIREMTVYKTDLLEA